MSQPNYVTYGTLTQPNEREIRETLKAPVSFADLDLLKAYLASATDTTIVLVLFEADNKVINDVISVLNTRALPKQIFVVTPSPKEVVIETDNEVLLERISCTADYKNVLWASTLDLNN